MFRNMYWIPIEMLINIHRLAPAISRLFNEISLETFMCAASTAISSGIYSKDPLDPH